MKWHRAIVPLAALVLASCGTSPKTQYFTLAAASGTQQEKFSISSPVTVAAVHVPPSLDRKEMVRRTGDNTVDISGQDRWTAPLGDMTRRVLSQDLAQRLPSDKVILPDSPAPAHTAQIVVSLAKFGSDANGRATLDGSWSLLRGDPATPVLHRTVALEVSTAGSAGSDEAAAMSALLGRLAGDIAATLAHTM